MTRTHTFATLPVSAEAYDEIAAKLRATGYDRAFVGDGTIDMHGLGLLPLPGDTRSTEVERLKLAHEARIKELDVGKKIQARLQRNAHEARVTELLAANNAEVDRRRDAVAQARDLERRLELAEHALGRIESLARDRSDPGVAVRSIILEIAQDALAERAQAGTPTLAEVIAQKDGAYEERNRLVSLLARMFPSGIAKTAIEGWAPEWENCVYIDLPTGQVSWHYHDREAHLFEGLPAYAGQWDGHDTAEKWRRVADAAEVDPLASLVGCFSLALLRKLRAAEQKYGYENGWLRADWRDDLVRHLMEHVAKGDPLDVAAYAAFAWHHGWSIAPKDQQEQAGEFVSSRFGADVLADLGERVDRVFEEAAELAQSEGRTADHMARILAYVFSRDVGSPPQEAAGVAVTLLAYGAAKRISIREVEAKEIARIMAKPAQHFRMRQAAKAALGVALAPTVED